jgi:hypothetical protein
MNMKNPNDIALFKRLRDLMAECEPHSNRHELAIVLISACITEGLDRGPRITGALQALGFNKQHIGMVLRQETGDNLARHHWQRVPGGRYRLLQPELVQA